MLGPERCCGLADDMVAALWRKRADELEPTPIGTAFRHYVLNMLRISRSWNSFFCWYITKYMPLRFAYYLSGTLLNFAVVFLTGLIRISRPS
jgi:hypothetical protein